MNTETNISRAIARTIVRHGKETVTILKKYCPIPQKISNRALINTVLTQLSENEAFATEFTELMKSKKTLTVSDPEHRNFATAIVSIVSAVAGVASNIIKKKQSKDAAEDQQTQELLKAIAAEKEAQAKQKRLQTMVVIASVLTFMGVAAVLIFKNKKK